MITICLACQTSFDDYLDSYDTWCGRCSRTNYLRVVSELYRNDWLRCVAEAWPFPDWGPPGRQGQVTASW